MAHTKAEMEFAAALKVILPLFDGDESAAMNAIGSTTSDVVANLEVGRLTAIKKIARAAPMLAAARAVLTEFGLTSEIDGHDIHDIWTKEFVVFREDPDEAEVDGSIPYVESGSFLLIRCGTSKYRLGGGDGYHRGYSKSALTLDQLRAEVAKIAAEDRLCRDSGMLARSDEAEEKARAGGP